MLTRLWKNILAIFSGCHDQKGDGVSIIIPFRKPKQNDRQYKNLIWIVEYWRCQMPGAQIIIGTDRSRLPFSKSAAINWAAKRAIGDIFVITDVDCYIDTEVVLNCCWEIRRARNRGQKLWYVPYQKFYRLTRKASDRVLASSPCHPYRFPTPPDPKDEESSRHHCHCKCRHHCHHHWSGCKRGHWYGAMIQILPREAFRCIRGWDPRFRGWGGEDHSAMRAIDTLYWPHKTTPNQVLHLWHPMLCKTGLSEWVLWENRIWDDQPKAGTNSQLTCRYSNAFGDVKKMQALVNEFKI